MRFCALLSGGKDSVYAAYLLQRQGHVLACAAQLAPPAGGPEELDSYMFQTVGHAAVSAVAACMGVPLYTTSLRGRPLCTSLDYAETEGDEVEDLHCLLQRVVEAEHIEGVSCGAVLSRYQRKRLEEVCGRLGLQALCPLWGWDQEELLRAMIRDGHEAIICKVATAGLGAQHLGRGISELFPELLRLRDRWGINVAGEGGEYETFTVSSPCFRHPLRFCTPHRVVVDKEDDLAPCAYLVLGDALVDNEAVLVPQSQTLLAPGNPADKIADTSSGAADGQQTVY